MTTVLNPVLYALERQCPIPWPSRPDPSTSSSPLFASTSAQEDIDAGIRYAQQRCVQALWLPDSIMPLAHLVRALRVPAIFKHAVLDPTLGSARAIQEYFHITLPEILASDTPEGVDRLTINAWSAAKKDSDLATFLEQAERRQIQIQVILYMLAITLPPLPEPVVEATSSRKQKRKAKEVDAAPPPLDARLEFFMDKLAIWQLTDGLASSFEGIEQDDKEPAKDWAQSFCEDIVEPLFKNVLPEQCALLRSKFFRQPRARSRSPSPSRPSSRPRSRSSTPNPGMPPGNPTTSRAPSPLRRSDLRREHSERSMSRQSSIGPAETGERSRSRSLSITAEDMANTGAHRNGVAGSSALFKYKTMPVRQPSVGIIPSENGGSKFKRTSSLSSSVTSISSTAATSRPPAVIKRKFSEPEQTLVPDTPIKKAKVETRASPDWNIPESPAKGSQQQGTSSQGQRPMIGGNKKGKSKATSQLRDPFAADEDMDMPMVVDNSPSKASVLSDLTELSEEEDAGTSDAEGAGAILVCETPTRQPRRR